MARALIAECLRAGDHGVDDPVLRENFEGFDFERGHLQRRPHGRLCLGYSCNGCLKDIIVTHVDEFDSHRPALLVVFHVLLFGLWFAAHCGERDSARTKAITPISALRKRFVSDVRKNEHV